MCNSHLDRTNLNACMHIDTSSLNKEHTFLTMMHRSVLWWVSQVSPMLPPAGVELLFAPVLPPVVVVSLFAQVLPPVVVVYHAAMPVAVEAGLLEGNGMQWSWNGY